MNTIAWIVTNFSLFYNGVQIKIQNVRNAVLKILKRNFRLLVARVLLIQARAVQEVRRILVSAEVVEDLLFAKPCVWPANLIYFRPFSKHIY